MGIERGYRGEVDFTWGWWSHREKCYRGRYEFRTASVPPSIYGLWYRITREREREGIFILPLVREAPFSMLTLSLSLSLHWTYIVLNIIVKVRSCARITTVSTIYVIVARAGRYIPWYSGHHNRCAGESLHMEDVFRRYVHLHHAYQSGRREIFRLISLLCFTLDKIPRKSFTY